MSQRFRTLEDFQSSTLNRLGKVLKEPLRFEVMNVIGGDREWATVELRAKPVECKNGMEYPMVSELALCNSFLAHLEYRYMRGYAGSTKKG